MSPNRLSSFLGERIGFKSGLALTREEIANHLGDTSPLTEVVLNYSDEPIKVGSYNITDAFQIVLFKLGILDRPFVGDGPTWLSIKYGKDDYLTLLLDGVVDLLGQFNNQKSVLGQAFDRGAFFNLVNSSLPSGALDIAVELIDYMQLGERASPWQWCEARAVDWRDTAELRDLFQSESLESLHGKFFDQRFVNYLARNFERISDMNWRKFEGLTAEYFLREGFEVEVGPGRDDGGIDVRVWKTGALTSSPPLIIVQCKRQKRKIEKAVVKSLWADLVDVNAGSGLIVTTSSLSPGAETVRQSRSYPIEVASSGHLKSWLEQLRTPGTGIYLGS